MAERDGSSSSKGGASRKGGPPRKGGSGPKRGSDSRSGGSSRGGPSNRGGDNRSGGSQGTGRSGDTGRGGHRSRPPARGPGRQEERQTQREREADGTIPGRKDWGGLARRGASKVLDYQDEGLEESPSPEERAKFQERQAKRQVEIDRREALRAEAKAAVERVTSGKPKKPAKKRVPKARERTVLPGRPKFVEDERTAIPRLLGEKEGKRELRRFDAAVKSYTAERFGEARKGFGHLAQVLPEVPVIREMLGLTLYRQGMWKEAVAELEQFRSLVGTSEQNPVLQDCYRAMGRWADVEVLWTELAEASPAGDLVVEGRIVAAGALADQGKLGEAITLLSKSWRQPKRPMEHHLRRAYALADLYERSGDLPRARALFAWLAGHEPEFVDVQDRLRNLR